MRSDSVLSNGMSKVYASYGILCVRTVFFRVVCQKFTPHTVFYAFGRCSFGFCVTALGMFYLVVRLPGLRGTVYRDA